PGCVVGAAAACFPRPQHVRGLLDLGGLARRPLLFRPVSFAVLFTGAFGFVAAQFIWTQTRVVARFAAVLARAADLVGARSVSPDLLLLPRRLLQSLLGGSAIVHCGRAAPELSRGALFPAHPAKRASLFPLPVPG